MQEIGHVIGLRHTDWKARATCNAGTVNEGQMAAVQVSGTVDQTQTRS